MKVTIDCPCRKGFSSQGTVSWRSGNLPIFSTVSFLQKEESLLTLQKSYDDLRHHVVELEREFRESGLITEVEAFETTVLEEETTREVRGNSGMNPLHTKKEEEKEKFANVFFSCQ